MEKILFKNILRDWCAMKIFCDVTGEILDYRKAVLIKHGDAEQVFSKNALPILQKRYGVDRVNALIQTPETYFKR